MSSDRNQVRLSKFLSLVLRHQPQEIGITLDEAGWIDVETLLAACQRHRHPLTLAQLQQVVATSDKQRFAFSEDGRRIRANQGHSVPVDLGYEPAIPPNVLFHGTAEKSLAGIRRDGLQKRKRHHVHLSERIETANAVGSRHGKLALLTVKSGAMHKAGIAFFRTPNGVWLVDEVPVSYLEFPPG